MAEFQNIVVQAYKPCAVDEAANFLAVWPSLTPTQQKLVYQEILKTSSSDQKIKVTCQSESEAQALVSAVNKVQSSLATYRIRSSTDAWKTYDVKYNLTTKKSESCTCPDYEFRGEANPDHVCKHMKKVQEGPYRYNRV